jgi:hypothetical protein
MNADPFAQETKMVATGEKLSYITIEWLESAGACDGQIERFRGTFGEGVEISRDAARIAASAGLDLDWIARELLEATAWAAYEQATATAWAAYKQATATAWAACSQATATAWAACEQATATAWADALGLP